MPPPKKPRGPRPKASQRSVLASLGRNAAASAATTPAAASAETPQPVSDASVTEGVNTEVAPEGVTTATVVHEQVAETTEGVVHEQVAETTEGVVHEQVAETDGTPDGAKNEDIGDDGVTSTQRTENQGTGDEGVTSTERTENQCTGDEGVTSTERAENQGTGDEGVTSTERTENQGTGDEGVTSTERTENQGTGDEGVTSTERTENQGTGTEGVTSTEHTENQGTGDEGMTSTEHTENKGTGDEGVVDSRRSMDLELDSLPDSISECNGEVPDAAPEQLPSDLPTGQLRDAFTKQLGNVSLAAHQALRAAVQRLATTTADTPLTVGSFFSGCEMIVHVLHAVTDVFQSSFGTRVQWTHEFSVEKDPWKRTFISEHSNPKDLFFDAVALSNENWAGKTSKGVRSSVVQVDIFTAGFECDTVSRLNRFAVDRAHCMAFAAGKTGTTGMATLKYIVAHRPGVSVLENSKVLGEHNLSYIVTLMTERGFDVFAFVAEASEWGSPSRRERQYLIIVPLTTEQTNNPQLPRANWTDKLDAMLMSMKIEAGNPYEYLYATDHPRYVAWHNERCRARDHAVDGQAGKKRKAPGIDGDDEEVWPADHIEVYRSFKLQWPPPVDLDPHFKEQTKHLSPRPFQVAYAHQYREVPSSEQRAEFVDLLYNMKWLSSRSDGITGCIVCGSKVWSTKLVKHITGQEAMFLQGFPQESLRDGFANNQYLHLGGNAFNGFAFTAIMGAILGCTPISGSDTESADPHEAATTSQHDTLAVAAEEPKVADALDFLSDDDDDEGGISLCDGSVSESAADST